MSIRKIELWLKTVPRILSFIAFGIALYALYRAQIDIALFAGFLTVFWIIAYEQERTILRYVETLKSKNNRKKLRLIKGGKSNGLQSDRPKKTDKRPKK
jgi:hypothetical protein